MTRHATYLFCECATGPGAVYVGGQGYPMGSVDDLRAYVEAMEGHSHGG